MMHSGGLKAQQPFIRITCRQCSMVKDTLPAGVRNLPVEYAQTQGGSLQPHGSSMVAT